MVTKHYPHTATLSYVSPGTFSSIGVWKGGSSVAIVITCDIQPNRSKLLTGADGDIIGYNYTIFCKPNEGFSSVPEGAKLEFFSSDHIIKQLFEYQHHVEILC